jgi:hypothetical protein
LLSWYKSTNTDAEGAVVRQFGAHLRRFRQRERRLFDEWQLSLSTLVKQALVLDQWSGVPSLYNTLELRTTEEKRVQGYRAALQEVAQERLRSWTAASTQTLDMQQVHTKPLVYTN